MGKTITALIGGMLAGAAGTWLFLAAAPDATPAPSAGAEAAATAVLPDLPEPYYKVLFENEAVRIVEHRLGQGESEPEHTHPPIVAYFVRGATAVITEADGSTSEATIPTGAFLEHLEWWTHSLQNTGDTLLHSIIIEFKQGAPANREARQP